MYAIPIIGLGLWAGIISGWIPSFLYEKNEKWPFQHMIFQGVLLLLTYLQLERDKISTKAKEKLYTDDLASYSTFLGTNLYKVFYGEGGGYLALQSIGCALVYLTAAFVPSQIIKMSGKEGKNVPLGTVFLRNFVLFLALTAFFSWEDLEEGDFGAYCEKFNPEGAFFGRFQ